MSGRQVDRRHFLGLAAAGAGGAALALGGCGGQARVAEAGMRGAAAGLPAGAEWELVGRMSDDFTGARLDTSKWTPHHAWGDYRANQVAFRPRNATVSGGRLHLLLSRETDPEHNDRHFSGVVTSKFMIGGDTFTKVRAKMIKSEANANSAIWLHARKTNVELDLHEYLKPERDSAVRSAVHLWDEPSDGQGCGNQDHWSRCTFSDPLGTPLDKKFFTYGVERRGGRVTFSIDGKPYWHVDDDALATEPQPLVLYIRGINDGEKINPNALDAEMLVDYVQVYRVK